MKTPTNTKLTLKRIIENSSIISPTEGFQDAPKKLSSEQKKELMEMAAKFEQYGQVFKNETAIMESAKAMSKLCELAETYAVNECGDVFQEEIVKKDMGNMKRRIMEYTKIAKECYAKMQQLNVAHEDIGHILGRYYNLKEIAEAFNTPGYDVANPPTTATPYNTFDVSKAETAVID